ncbi:hypothetical protein F050043D4_47630 [Bacteroides thetaiotaomicron]
MLSCSKDDDYNPFVIEGVSMSNYPKVDCSTSTQMLQTIIACKLLGVKYEWKENMLFGGFYELHINYDDKKGSKEFFDQLKVSTTHGSFMNLIDGEADVIVTSRGVSRDEKAYADGLGVRLEETPIALDGFIFITNPNNPVNNLTEKQIQDIYMGNITNWNQLGGKDILITPYIREPNSGSQEKMETIIMKGLEMPTWEYTQLTGMAGPFGQLRSDETGICYSVYYYNRFFVEPNLVKLLSINGIAPTQQNIRNRAYPYTTEVYTAIRADLDRNSTAYKLYSLLCSGNAKNIIEDSGYVAK